MQTNTKIKFCAGLCAAACLLPATAWAGRYQADTDTGVDVLDYIENQRRAERENRLTPEQQKLALDCAAMQKQLRKPIDPVKKQLPVAIEGDDLLYDQKTGDCYAKGNVVITEIDARRFTTDEAKGNLKQQEVKVDGKAHMLQMKPGAQRITLDGWQTLYNYGTQTGQMAEAKGKVDHQYITGKRIEFYPDEVIIYDGTATKCSAKKPDYHVAAKKIEIWKDHMILHQARYYLGSVVLYQKDRVYKDTTKEDSTAYPRVGYDNDDGWWIAQMLDTDLAPRVKAYADIKYTGKWNFRNVYGLDWQNAHSDYRLEYGHFEDSDNHWVKKEPTFTYDYTNHFHGAPFSYEFKHEIGRWYKDNTTSTHNFSYIGLNRDPIRFNKGFTLLLSTGYSVTRESYDHSAVRGFNYDATLLKEFDKRWTIYTGYHYSKTNSQNSLFNFNVDDYSRKLEAGLSYRFSDKDRIVIGENYDLDNKNIKDVDYYWFHDIHCAQLILRYRAKRHTWHIGFQFLPW